MVLSDNSGQHPQLRRAISPATVVKRPLHSTAFCLAVGMSHQRGTSELERIIHLIGIPYPRALIGSVAEGRKRAEAPHSSYLGQLLNAQDIARGFKNGERTGEGDSKRKRPRVESGGEGVQQLPLRREQKPALRLMRQHDAGRRSPAPLTSRTIIRARDTAIEVSAG